MPVDPFEVHSVKLDDQNVFLRGGGTAIRHVLTFSVGEIGSFIRYFDAGMATESALKAEIDKQVALLKAITPVKR